MHALLFIPWFRLTAWDIPLPFSLPVLGDTLSIQPFGVLVATGAVSYTHLTLPTTSP
mgnify:CR=1 FL=1